jgi:hypothetical protein
VFVFGQALSEYGHCQADNLSSISYVSVSYGASSCSDDGHKIAPYSGGFVYFRRKPMAYFERMRDVIHGPLRQDLLRQRTEAGWQVVSVEWRRELPGNAPEGTLDTEDVPYGLRLSEDCLRLEIDPPENQALMQMMELLVQDFPFSSVASDLNEKGYRTREGKRWTPVTVFNMLPRLIDVGPRVFSTEEWDRRRERFAAKVG